MPRKSKITAVPVTDHDVEGLVRAWGDDEENNDAEQMTDIINEVKVIEEPTDALPQAPQVEAEAPIVEAPKAKAKRASRAKPKEEPQVDTNSSLDETQVVVTIPTQEEEAKTEAKTDAKVSCPDCGKQMSAKTLKYSHVPNCPAKKQQQSPRELPASSIMEEVIENEVQKRMNNKRAERAARREEMVQKLMQNAF